MNYFFKTLILSFFIFSFNVQAQSVDSTINKKAMAKNSVFVEILGNAFSLGSLNYDRIIFQSKIIKLSLSTGIGLYPLTDSYLQPKKTYFEYGIPLSVNALIGKRNHFLEIGVGLTYSKGAEASFSHDHSTNQAGVTNDTYNEYFSELLVFVPRVGYRFQKNKHGFFFRVGFTPLIILKDYTRLDLIMPGIGRFLTFNPNGGISLGYSFK